MSTDEELLVTDNLKLAYNISWKFAKKLRYFMEYEDIQSLALLGLVKAAKSYNKQLGFSFSTYAYRIMQNEILTECYKLNKSVITISIHEPINDNITLEDMLITDVDHEENLSNKLSIALLYKEIDKLPDKLKTIIYYRLQNYTFTKIGKILGLSQQQISKDYQKALNILRNKLMKGGNRY